LTTLKRVLALSLCLCMLFLLGCTGQSSQESTTAATTAATEAKEEGPLTDGKTLKILAVTSSFGLNSTEFLYDVAIAEGFTDVVVGRLYASGCTLETHVDCARNNTNHYQYTKNSSGKWEKKESIPLLYGLQDEDWDIIFMQQSAHRSPLPESYTSIDGVDYIDELVSFVNKNMTNPNARFVWNLCWAFEAGAPESECWNRYDKDQLKMYQGLIDTLKLHVLPKTHFDAIIPTGTAVQNLRTSYIGDTLTKDKLHLNYIGKVLAAYTLLSVLTEKPSTEINLTTVSPSTDPVPEMFLTENDKLAIMEAINNAIANPYEVTQSIYTEK